MALGIVLTGPIVSTSRADRHLPTPRVHLELRQVGADRLALRVMIGVIYYASPNVKQRGSSGSLRAGSSRSWSGCSPRGFGLYVSQFGSYNAVYGSLAGVVIILIWMWITNLAISSDTSSTPSANVSSNSRRGVPGAEREIQLEPRDEPERRRTV
jgi:membrane protein